MRLLVLFCLLSSVAFADPDPVLIDAERRIEAIRINPDHVRENPQAALRLLTELRQSVATMQAKVMQTHQSIVQTGHLIVTFEGLQETHPQLVPDSALNYLRQARMAELQNIVVARRVANQMRLKTAALEEGLRNLAEN